MCLHIADFTSDGRSPRRALKMNFLNIYIDPLWYYHIIIMSWGTSKKHPRVRILLCWNLWLNRQKTPTSFPIKNPPLPAKVLASVRWRRLGVSKWPLGLDIVSRRRFWISHKLYQSLGRPLHPSAKVPLRCIKMQEGWSEPPEEDINNLVILMVGTAVTHAGKALPVAPRHAHSWRKSKANWN